MAPDPTRPTKKILSHPTEKLPFKAMAAQDKKRYDDQMSTYEPTPGFEKGAKKRSVASERHCRLASLSTL
jgi:hypothetical protein